MCTCYVISTQIQQFCNGLNGVGDQLRRLNTANEKQCIPSSYTLKCILKSQAGITKYIRVYVT